MSTIALRLALCAALLALPGCAHWFAPRDTPEEIAQQDLPPDTIRVRGDVLRGRLVRLTAKTVEFETVYGEGTLSIKYEDVEELVAHGRYVIRHGDSYETAQGRLLGFDDGQVLVGSEQALEQEAVEESGEKAEPAAGVERVALESIKRAVREEDFDDSWLTRMRTRYSHWKADFDLGVALEEGAVDKQKVNIGLDVDRRKAPTWMRYEMLYAFENQKTTGEPRVKTKDEFFSTLRLEYDVWEEFPRLFAIGWGGGEWDKPRGIQARTFPAAGVGYRLFDSEKLLFQTFGGFGFVFQNFKGAGDQDWAAAMMGTDLRWQLPLEAELSMGLFYMPRIDEFTKDWLFRYRILFTMPIWDPVTLRFRVTEVNDANPSPDIGNNKVTTTLGIGLRF